MIQKRTIGIISTGNVGVAVAYALFLKARASKIFLIDINRKKAEGEAMDLTHGQAFVEKTVVHAGDYADLAAAQIVNITAGVAQQPGESRIHNICISIPAVLGRNGVEATIQPDLSATEVEGLRRSAQLLKRQLADFDL